MNPPVLVELPQASVNNEAKHRNAAELFEQKRFADAARLLSEMLAAEESAELWNDWSTAEFALGQISEAEHGFRRALELAPGNRQISENLGALLAGRQLMSEAICLLKQSLGAENKRQTVADCAALVELREATLGMAGRIPRKT